MLKRNALIVVSLLLLAACAGGPGAEFSIAQGPLKPEEMSFANYGQAQLAARVFDVVNQDQTAESNTGIAGRVQPMPVDVLSAYAASKFHATGGIFNARFVIKQASFQVRNVSPPSKSGFFSFMDGGSDRAEMALDITVMVVATRPDGTGATINATTSQTQQAEYSGTPEEHRAIYLGLLTRALQALDGEISRQLPTYFMGITK
ncbi:MAG TPA: hypothetical protein VHB73_02355 [Alphaproteobacteria bacterium]|nr:hypothetical protein [Alphaproteobacteria bacterium]